MAYRRRRQISTETLLVACVTCDLTVRKLSQLQVHAKCHDEDEACFVCVCSEDYSLLTFSELKSHCQAKHKEHVFHCAKCQTLFTSASSLLVHERTHTGEKPYACPLCEYKSAQTSSLNQHIRTHTGDKPFVCHLCDYASAQGGKLYRHMRQHAEFQYTGPQAVQHPCPECSAEFTQRAHLTRHMALHTGHRPFKCSICPYASSELSSLRRHTFRHFGRPTGATLINCPQAGCPYRSDRQSRIKRHSVVHTGEKPFNCQYCGRFYSEQATVVKHIRNKHSEVTDKFTCSVCNFFAVSSETLKSHESRCHVLKTEFPVKREETGSEKLF